MAALLFVLALAFARPVHAARPLTDAESAQDLARAETLIGLGEYEEAVTILKMLTERGYVRAAVRLADLLYGEVALMDIETGANAGDQRAALDLAIEFYQDAVSVDGGHYDQASRRLARLLLLREQDPDSVRGAIDQLRRLIVLGSGPAAYDLGRAYLFGRGVPTNPREADRFLLMAIEQGEYKAARLLGIVYYRGLNRPPDMDRAIEYLKLALAHDEYEAATYLGLIHAGRGDYDKAIAATGEAIRILTQLYDADPQSLYAMRLAELYLRDPYWPQDQAQGIAWLDRAASDGTGLAAYRLFQIYASDDFGPHDLGVANGYAHQVADARYWSAIPTIAHHYLADACLTPDEAEQAVNWLTSASVSGDANAMHTLATALGGDWACVATDIAASRDWMLAAARAEWGTNEDVLDLGRLVLETATDEATIRYGLDLLAAAAERGNVAAKTDLGQYLVEDSGDPADYARGMDMLREVANQENGDRAMSTLGRALLYSADEAERDEAVLWLQRAVGYGRPDAMRILGRIYLEGMVVSADVARAEQLLLRGLAYGDGESGVLLADIYQAGLGGRVDFDRAHRVLEQASALGSAEAMLRLSEVYRLGLGVEVQPERADALLSQAAAAGNTQAQMLMQTAVPPLTEVRSVEG